MDYKQFRDSGEGLGCGIFCSFAANLKRHEENTAHSYAFGDYGTCFVQKTSQLQ